MSDHGDMDVSGHGYYTLDENRNPVEATSLLEWARWLEHTPNRIVKQEQIGPCWVSTVFLGMDHAHHALALRLPHTPILFETMAFVGSGETREALDVQERCATWEQAEGQHARIVAEIRKAVTC